MDKLMYKLRKWLRGIKKWSRNLPEKWPKGTTVWLPKHPGRGVAYVEHIEWDDGRKWYYLHFPNDRGWDAYYWEESMRKFHIPNYGEEDD